MACRLLGQQFLHFLQQMSLTSFGISRTGFRNLSVAVDDEHVGNHLDTEGTLEVAVGVEQHLILSSVPVNKGFHLINMLCLVDADGNHLDAGFLFPFVIHLADSR